MPFFNLNIRYHKWPKLKRKNKILARPIYLSEPKGDTPFAQRRKDILEKIKKSPLQRIPVNREGCWKTNTNEPIAKDLRRMIKLGDIKLVREQHGSFWSNHTQISFIMRR